MLLGILEITKRALRRTQNSFKPEAFPDPFQIFFKTLILYSVFNILCQLGVGPEYPCSISGYEDLWSDFLMGNANLVMVKSFMFMKVRMMFDPPSGSAYNAFTENLKELEWRLNWQREVERVEEGQ